MSVKFYLLPSLTNIFQFDNLYQNTYEFYFKLEDVDLFSDIDTVCWRAVVRRGYGGANKSRINRSYRCNYRLREVN